MNIKRTCALALTSLALVASGTLPAAANAAEPDTTTTAQSAAQAAQSSKIVKKSLRRLIKDLPVKAESNSGYDRAKFRHWIDQNGDCQDARSEVLRSESKKRVTGACTVKTGRWVSMYDGKVVTKASKVHIDHMIPLAEAWGSGAKKWNADTRKRFANDVADYRALAAVSASSNLSKGDRDPGDWLPERRVCTYIHHWAAVKTRWGLTVSKREKRVLVEEAEFCPNSTIKVTKAAINTGTKTTPRPTSKPKPQPAPKPSGTDPRFGTCTEAKRYGYGPYYAGSDPEYYWYQDRDGDGIVCE